MKIHQTVRVRATGRDMSGIRILVTVPIRKYSITRHMINHRLDHSNVDPLPSAVLFVKPEIRESPPVPTLVDCAETRLRIKHDDVVGFGPFVITGVFGIFVAELIFVLFAAIWLPVKKYRR